MPKKVLVADDEEEIVELLTVALEGAGYAVVSTIHGSRIPGLVEKEKPDLMILDVMMPGIDGYSLQLQFAENKSTKDIPVIIMTALPASRKLFERFPQMKHFVSKPFETEEITKKVQELLGN